MARMTTRKYVAQAYRYAIAAAMEKLDHRLASCPGDEPGDEGAVEELGFTVQFPIGGRIYAGRSIAIRVSAEVVGPEEAPKAIIPPKLRAAIKGLGLIPE